MSKEDMNKGMNKVNDKKGEKTMQWGDEVENPPIIETGVFALDYANGGGIGEGHVNLLVGWEGSGKTAIAFKTLANYQRKYQDFFPNGQPPLAVYLDAERVFNKNLAQIHNVEAADVAVIRPLTAEDGIDAFIAMAENYPQVKFMIIDSTAALIPKKQAEAATADITVASKPKLMESFMNQILPIQTARANAGNHLTVLLISQYRSKITMFGDPKVIAGGNAQRFFADTVVEVKKGKQTTEKDSNGIEVIDEVTHSFNIIKGRGNTMVAGEFQFNKSHESVLPIMAVDDYDTVITYAKAHGLIEGAGGSGIKRVYGIDQEFKTTAEIRPYLIEHPYECTELKSQLIALKRQQIGLPDLPPDNYLLKWHPKNA